MMKRWLALLLILPGCVAGCGSHKKSVPAPLPSHQPIVPRSANRPAALPIGSHPGQTVPLRSTGATGSSGSSFVGTWKLDYPLTRHETLQLRAAGRPPVATAAYHLQPGGTFTVSILDGAGGGIYSVDGMKIKLTPTVMKGEILTPEQQERVSIEGVLDPKGQTIDFNGHKAVKQ